MQSAQLYFDYVCDAVSRGSVPELLSIWKDSLALASTGAEMRELITSKLAEIGKIHKMDIEEGISFKDFLAAHRIHLIDLRCQKGPKKTAVEYAKEGNWEAMFHILDKIYAKDPLEVETALQDCAEVYGASASVADVETFLENVAKYTKETSLVDDVLVGAVKGNNDAVVEWSLKHPDAGSFSNQRALRAAIKTNQEKWISFFLDKPLESLHYVLQEAVAVNNTELIEHLLAIAEDDEIIHYGLQGAVEGGHLDAVKMFLQLGADVWRGFNATAKYGQLEMAKFLLLKGPVRWNQFVEEAVINDHVHILEYFFQAAPEEEKQDLQELVEVVCAFESYQTGAYLLSQGIEATAEQRELIELAL